MSLPVVAEPLPSSYNFGKVTGRVIHLIADTAEDTDDKPQARAAAGKVTFKPKEVLRKTTDASYPAIVLHAPETATLSSSGRILDAEGRQGIWLAVGIYTVTFEVTKAPRAIPDFDIQVTAEHTDAAPLDLATVVPYVPPSGTFVQTLLVPSGGTEGQVLVRTAEGGLVWADQGGGLTAEEIADDPIVAAAFAPADRFRTQPSGAANPPGENLYATETGVIHSTAGASIIVGGSSAPYENVIGGDTATVGTTTSNVPVAEPTLTPAPSWNAVLGGYDNVVNGWAMQVQGYHCKVEQNASHGTISGGSMHTMDGAIDYATIGGGNQNRSTGTGGTIAGGLENTTGPNASILGGRLNQATGSNASITGGNQCVASGNYAAIGGGLRNQSTGTSSTVVGGQDNAASGTAATVMGRDSLASGAAATAQGRDALANLSGMVAQSSGKFAAQGDAQSASLTARCETTDATPKPLLLDNTSGHIVIPVDTTWQFDVSVVARGVTANESAAYKFTGCIKRDATGSSTALVGSVVNLLTAEQVPGWDVQVVADTPSVSLRVLATGEAGKAIRWVARVDLVQLTC